MTPEEFLAEQKRLLEESQKENAKLLEELKKVQSQQQPNPQDDQGQAPQPNPNPNLETNPANQSQDKIKPYKGKAYYGDMEFD